MDFKIQILLIVNVIVPNVANFRGGFPSFVTVCDRGRNEVTFGQNSVTYFVGSL